MQTKRSQAKSTSPDRPRRRPRLDASSYPRVLPHFSFANGALNFGAQRQRDERTGEADRAARLTGTKSIADFEGEGPAMLKALGAQSYISWWDAPVGAHQGGPVEDRPRWLTLSPHSDDAELSMGGTLIAERKRVRIENVVCFSLLEHSLHPAAFRDSCETSLIRKAEARVAADMLSQSVHFIDFPEFSIRKRLTPEPRLPDKEAATREALKRSIVDRIARFNPEKVFAPAAIGNHPDHRMVFDIVLDLIDQDLFPETEFHLYEDAPYSARYIHIDDFLSRFEDSYLSVQSWDQPIAAELRLKQELVKVFRSQFHLSVAKLVETLAERSAKIAKLHGSDPGSHAERFWTVGIYDLPGDHAPWTSSSSTSN